MMNTASIPLESGGIVQFEWTGTETRCIHPRQTFWFDPVAGECPWTHPTWDLQAMQDHVSGAHP